MDIADAETNDLIRINQAIKTEIPGHPSAATVWRWATRGLAPAIAGEPRIKLDVLYVGATPYTTRAAIREFLNRATQARLDRMAATQKRAADVTDDELTSVGLTASSMASSRMN